MSDRLAAIDIRLTLLTWMVGVDQAMTLDGAVAGLRPWLREAAA